MKTTRPFLAAGLALTLFVTAAAGPPLRADDTELTEGIRQAQQGEFEAAALTLDRVTRRLAAARAPGRDLARAYVYLGVAQLGLGQETKAKASFVEARRSDPSLRLDTAEFPPKIVQAYEQALREAAVASPAPAPSPAAPRAAATPAPEKKGGSKALWVVLGAVAVGGGVAAAASGGGGGGGGAATTTTTLRTIPDISGRWMGAGANAGEFLVTSDCRIHNSIDMNLNQSGGTFAGPADFVVLESCNPSAVGFRVRYMITGTVDLNGQISLRFADGPFPSEIWTGAVNAARNRMEGTITGIPGLTSGTWAVNR